MCLSNFEGEWGLKMGDEVVVNNVCDWCLLFELKIRD